MNYRHRILLLIILFLFTFIFSEEFYNRFSFGVESRGSVYGLIPFANHFYLKAGYPWSGVGFNVDFGADFFPAICGDIEFSLKKPLSNFFADFMVEIEYQNLGMRSGLEIEFEDFSQDEKGRFYYVFGPYFELNGVKFSVDFRYHFLSVIYDEVDSFYYNWPSPVSEDLMSMSNIDFRLSYILFGDKFNSKVNMKIFGGYKLGLAWSSYLGEALYRPNKFYFGIMFGI
ncbi:MAG: hypothetical protein PWQ20_429 [Thermotogaceae bacterium]|jgi:hypothetical protein|nr:hypothetical protein [Thermotogaceae bacterium]MDN5337359.1 hypothetical protein [Thermotogaceae bacterium]